MSIAPFVQVPQFTKDSVSAAEAAPDLTDFVDFGGQGYRQRSSPYDGTWRGDPGLIPNLDAYQFDFIRFAFGGVDADADSVGVTIWELVAGRSPVAVAVATVELDAGGNIPSVQIPRSFGAYYAVTVSDLTGESAEVSFTVAVRGEYMARFAAVGMGV